MPTDKVVWSGTPNLQQFEFFARQQILKVADVLSVEDFTVTTLNDKIHYIATIKTIHGTDTINGSV